MTEAQAVSPPTKPFDSIYSQGWEGRSSLIYTVKSQFNPELFKWFIFIDLALYMWKEPSASFQGSGGSAVHKFQL